MAAPRLISSVEVWDHARTAHIAIPDVSPTTYDLYPYVAEQGLEIKDVLGDFGRQGDGTGGKITFVGPGAPPVVATPVYLSNRRVLRLIYDDASFEELRIVRFSRELSGQDAPSIDLEPIWMDLSTQIATRTASNKVVPVIYMIGRTAQSILDELEDYFPAHFQAGSAGSYAPTVVSLVSIADNSLKLLRDLCQAVSAATGGVCEWDYAWNAVDSKYDIDLTDGIGGTLAHPIEFGWGDVNNRVQLTKTEDFGEYFSRVIPLGGPDEEIGTIAEASWSVTAAVYDGGTGRTTLTLADDPIYVDGSPGTSGIDFGNATQGFFTVYSSTAPATVVVTGDASGLNGNTGKFQLTTGADLIYISDPTAESTAGPVEQVERRSEVAPVENLLLAAGVTPDLDDWTAGMPDGTQAVGTPTITQTTTAEYVQAGTSSADVQADADEGVRTDNISLAPTDSAPYFSAWFGLRIVSGSVRMELIGSDSKSYPLGDVAKGTGDVFQGLLIGGMKPPAGSAYLQITALEASTHFVLDSWTLTQTSTPYAWTEDMGANALWHIGGALLATKGGIQPNRFQGEWFDYAWILPAGTDEAEIGGKCQILDGESGGSYGVDVEVRLVELTRQYGGKNFVRKGRFGHRAQDLTDFLFNGNRRRSLPPGAGLGAPAGGDAKLMVTSAGVTYWLFSRTDPRVTAVYYDQSTGGWPAVTLADSNTSTFPDQVATGVTLTPDQTLYGCARFLTPDGGLGELVRASITRPGTAALITARLRAVVSNGTADLFLSVEAPTDLYNIAAYIYANDPTGSPIVTHSFTADDEIGPSDYAALDDRTLPTKEAERYWAKVVPAVGEPVWIFCMADRDGIPGGAVSPDDAKAAAGFEIQYDDDTTQVKLYRPGGSGTAYTKTWTGLSGGGRVTFTLGSTTMDDGSTVPSTLSEGEETGDWIVEVTGGGKTLEIFRGPLHGPKKPYECIFTSLSLTAAAASINGAEALTDGSSSGQTLSYKDGTSAWANAPTNPDDIAINRPSVGAGPKEVLLGVLDGSNRRGVVSVSIPEQVAPALAYGTCSVEDDATDNIYTTTWSPNAGVTDTDHDIEILFYENDVYAGSTTEASPATNTSKVWTDTGAGDGSADYHYAVIQLKDSTGNVIQSITTRRMISAL